MKFKAKVINAITKIVAKLTGGTAQDEAAGILEGKITEGMPELIREAGQEGCVLLKNEGVLPFTKDRQISVFGRVQYDYFATGYGSGGDVRKPYVINLIDGLKNCEELSINEELADIYKKWVAENEVDHGFWAHWPRSYPEMPLTEEIVKNARKTSNDAIVVLGRSSGEDRENVLEQGSYFLTDEEHAMILAIAKEFDNITLLLNIGSVMDMSFVQEFKDKIKAIMIVWQGGMESGNSVADLLSAKATPSGHLADTIVKDYNDYPCAKDFGHNDFCNSVEDIYVGYRYFETFKKDKVVYPFGFGLSYTTFTQEVVKVEELAKSLRISVKVKNVGSKYSGKESVQVYLQKPNEPIDNPYRQLVGFTKTSLLEPNKEEIVTVEVPYDLMKMYDEIGLTGFKSSYVLEKGDYIFSVGNNVRDAIDAYKITKAQNECVQTLSEVMAPKYKFDIIKNENGKVAFKPVNTVTINLKGLIDSRRPEDIALTGDKGFKLKDVKDGKVSIEEFVAQLSIDELEAITRGDYTMDSPLGAPGNAGAIGGVLPSMREKGIPAIITTDGPSGIRLYSSCSLIPIGTALACTFNYPLVEKLHEKLGFEMVDRGSDVLLSPGMNIHRSPLCGRNFEYFSEDPFLTGKSAAAVVNGIQTNGVTCCPKHFACNNQETKRTTTDARVSERALREIYLKGFEICLKESAPKTIMTSYNKINGVWNHYNFELCDTILRCEWKYEGLVMTDWWMQPSKSPEYPIKDQAYRVKSRVNVFMPGGKRLGKKKPDGSVVKALHNGGLTLGELQRNAIDVLNVLIKSNKM